MRRWHHHHHAHDHAHDQAHYEWQARHRWLLRTPRVRRLQARLFFWFLAAILAAFGAAMGTASVMRSAEPPSAPNLATRAIATHLARDWNDQEACDAYVARVRDLIGLDVRVR